VLWETGSVGLGFSMPGIHDFTTGFKFTKVKGNLEKFDFNKLIIQAISHTKYK
jgi:hypothetical protein